MKDQKRSSLFIRDLCVCNTRQKLFFYLFSALELTQALQDTPIVLKKDYFVFFLLVFGLNDYSNL